MRARPHGHPLPVDHGGDVVGMRALHLEGDDPTLVLGRADEAHGIHRAQALLGIGREVRLVRGDALAVEAHHEFQRRAEAHRLDDRGRPGLEAVRRVVVGDGVLGDGTDHLAAALVGGQALEPFALPVEHADPGRSVDLVAGEDVEIAIEGAHVDAAVDGALGPVEQHRHAVGMGDADDLLGRRHRAEHVRHVGDRHHLGAGREQLLVLINEEIARVVDGRPLDDGPPALAQEVPGHDVGMVLHDREDDLVTLLDHPGPAHRAGHEVVGLGGVAGEDDLVRGAGIEELARGFARALEPLGRGIRHEMQAAMDVGVTRLHAGHHGVDHRARLLRRGGVVEINQGLAVDGLGQDRELRPDRVDIVGGLQHGCVHGISPEPLGITPPPPRERGAGAKRMASRAAPGSRAGSRRLPLEAFRKRHHPRVRPRRGCPRRAGIVAGPPDLSRAWRARPRLR
ncbi:hypothetical protein AEGHOMDF_1830 [Methylobacterium soli]|nr:hypothetical protein AEGHOMDF_1830 [Methylobacterium soli]